MSTILDVCTLYMGVSDAARPPMGQVQWRGSLARWTPYHPAGSVKGIWRLGEALSLAVSVDGTLAALSLRLAEPLAQGSVPLVPEKRSGASLRVQGTPISDQSPVPPALNGRHDPLRAVLWVGLPRSEPAEQEPPAVDCDAAAPGRPTASDLPFGNPMAADVPPAQDVRVVSIAVGISVTLARDGRLLGLLLDAP